QDLRRRVETGEAHASDPFPFVVLGRVDRERAPVGAGQDGRAFAEEEERRGEKWGEVLVARVLEERHEVVALVEDHPLVERNGGSSPSPPGEEGGRRRRL